MSTTHVTAALYRNRNIFAPSLFLTLHPGRGGQPKQIYKNIFKPSVFSVSHFPKIMFYSFKTPPWSLITPQFMFDPVQTLFFSGLIKFDPVQRRFVQTRLNFKQTFTDPRRLIQSLTVSCNLAKTL